MRLWIEDDKGSMIECEAVKEVSVPGSILVFETDMRLTKTRRDEFNAYIRDRTRHGCVLVDGGIRLVAQVSPGELCGK